MPLTMLVARFHCNVSFVATKCTPKLDITSGKKTTLFGDGKSYGSVEKFTCNEGYELTGSPVVICQKDGTWSGSDQIQCQSMYDTTR